MNIKARVLAAVIFALVVQVGFLLSGEYPTEPGTTAVLAYIYTVAAVVIGLTCPLFDHRDRGD